MSGLFESIGSTDRGLDDRVLEGRPLQLALVGLLITVFTLGADVALALYAFVHLHRIAWSIAVVLPGLAWLLLFVRGLSIGDLNAKNRTLSDIAAVC